VICRPTIPALALLLLAAGCRPREATPVPPPPAGTVRLTILSTNDLHGQLDPLRRFTTGADPRTYRVGGAEALAATIAELRSENPQGTILLDAGDVMQGSLLSNRAEGRPMRDLLGLLGYDGMAIGNHELDFGPVGVPDPPLSAGADPRGALKAWCRGAPFPVLSANLTDDAGRALTWPGLRATALLRRAGISVGLLGLTTPETSVTTMPAFARGLRFAPWLPVVRREARALRAAGAQVVIVVAHGNAECPAPEASSCRGELFSELLDALEPGLVDAVVVGHSHQPVAHLYRGVPVIEGCSRGQVVARAELVVDRRSGRVLPALSRALPPRHVCRDVFARSGDCQEPRPAAELALHRGASAGGEQGKFALHLLQPSPLLERHRELVGRVRQLLDRYRPRIADATRRVLTSAARPVRHLRSGSEVGTLFADAVLAAVPGADAAIFNAGSVRSDLPSGAVSYADLFEAFPFENRLATIQLSGAQVTSVLTLLTARAYGVPSVAGLRLSLRCGPPQELASVTDAAGRPLREDRLYTVVISDFLLTGGDGLGSVFDTVPAARKQILQEQPIRDAIARYLERQPRPLNTAATPVLAPDAPRAVFLEGPCKRLKKRERAFCR